MLAVITASKYNRNRLMMQMMFHFDIHEVSWFFLVLTIYLILCPKYLFYLHCMDQYDNNGIASALE